MSADTTDTKVLPVPESADTADGPASYALDLDRCLIEISLRPLGPRLVRTRLRARAGELVQAGRPPVATIRMDVLAGPVVFLSRARRLSFTAADVEVRMDGQVEVDGALPWSLPLTVRFVNIDDNAIVLAARGPVRPPSGGRAMRMWVDAAVEFTR